MADNLQSEFPNGDIFFICIVSFFLIVCIVSLFLENLYCLTFQERIRISGKGAHMYKSVGFALMILSHLKRNPMKMK